MLSGSSIFLQSVAHEVTEENQKLKDQIIELNKSIHLYEHTMIQQIQKCSDRSVIFETPYQCLQAFIQSVHFSNDETSKIEKKYQKLSIKNAQLIQKMEQMKEDNTNKAESRQLINQSLSKTISEKDIKINALQDSQEILKTQLKITENEFTKTKQNLQILKLKMYEEQRQKMTQMMVLHRRQMAQFRQNLETQAYMSESIIRNEVQKKNSEIKALVKNLQSFSKIDDSQKNITILKEIIKPFSQHSQLNYLINQLRSQLGQIKQQKRNIQNKFIQFQAKYGTLSNECQLWKNKYRKQNNQMEQLKIKYKAIIEKLDKTQNDIKAIQLFYEEKWNNQFNSVRVGLEKKYQIKQRQLKRQYDQKKRNIQIEMNKIRLQNQQFKIKIEKLNKQLIEKNYKIEFSQEEIKDKNTIIIELEAIINESNQMINQDRLATKIEKITIQTMTNQQIQCLRQQIKKLSKNIDKISQENINQIKFLKQNHESDLNTITEKYENQIKEIRVKSERQNIQVEQKYTDIRQHVSNIRLDEQGKFEERIGKIIEEYKQKEKQCEANHELKIAQIEEKYKELNYRITQMKKNNKEQRDKKNWEIKLMEQQIRKRDSEIIQKEIRIKSIEQMKQNYEQNIIDKNRHIEETSKSMKCLDTNVVNKNELIDNLKQEICYLKEDQNNWFRMIKQLKAQYKMEFIDLKDNTRKQISIYKSKIWQLQQIINSRGTGEKEKQTIRNLQTKLISQGEEITNMEAKIGVLQQIKDYYESKFKHIQIKNINSELKNQSLYVIKPKRKKVLHLKTQKHYEQIFQPKQVQQMKKYIQKRKIQSKNTPTNKQRHSSLI